MAEIKEAKLNDLIQDDRNLNKGTERGQQLIEKSLREFGAGRSVLIDKNNRIIAGNKTHQNAELAGLDDVIIVETDGTKLVAVKRTDVDLDTKKGREMALADNATTKADLSWDTEELNAVAEDFGIDTDEWDVELNEMPVDLTEATEDDFDEEQDEIKPVVQRGDVFLLGEHRLMCGDSTSEDDVAKLMNGCVAQMTFTSPPYNGNNTMPQQSMKKGNIVTSKHLYDNGYEDNLQSDEYVKFCASVLDLCFAHTNGFVFWNVNYNANSRHEYISQIVDKLPYLIEQICWKKQSSIPFKGSMKRIWEPIYLFSTNGEKLKLKECVENLWEVSNYNVNGGDHFACFPVELVSKAFKVTQAQSVLDPFGGTGTTMIAAEQLGRKCYMMELDEHYCDVIIARWEKLTGKKAVKVYENNSPQPTEQ